MSKKVLSIIIAILVIIILIATISSIKHYNQRKQAEKFMNYVTSTEVDSDIKTPELMHIVLAAYKGNCEGLNIVKSINYIANNTIPEINKKCGNKMSAKIYYNNNKYKIEKQTGIKSFDEFYKLVERCKVSKKSNTVESMRADVNSIERESNGVKARIYVKYNDSDEISFDIKILNDVFSDKTSVIIK